MEAVAEDMDHAVEMGEDMGMDRVETEDIVAVCLNNSRIRHSLTLDHHQVREWVFGLL
jgi:hypothetical protein